jgi:hypothetical protein
MLKNQRIQILVVLAAGVLLGYGVGAGGLRVTWQADAAPAANKPANAAPAPLPTAQQPAGCCMAGHERGVQVAQAGKDGKKPNILVIMGDDVGWFNIGAYHRGMMYVAGWW